MFIELINNIDFNNSNFVNINEKLLINNSTLMNFFTIFTTISINFDNFDFDNAIEIFSIDNLISTNFIIFEITTIDIVVFVENCSFFDIINNNFRK